MTEDDVNMFASLFAGRTDGRGLWGGSLVEEQVTVDTYRRHLGVGPFIGIYPLLPDGTCWWGCVDIDEKVEHVPINLVNAFGHFNVAAWMEETRKGYHVWLFMSEPTPASVVRGAQMAACQIVGYDPKEVNPKQDHLEPGRWGNYVRLPYPGGDGSAERYIVKNKRRLSLTEFVRLAFNTRATPADVAAIANLYQPPKPNVIYRQVSPTTSLGTINRMGGLAFKIFHEGPLEGMDRSTTLAHLAHLLADEGFSAQDMFTLLCDADARWGKFSARPDRDEQISKLIDNALR